MSITITDILLLIPVSIGSAIFCVFLAIGVGYISFSKKVPKTIFWVAIITQVMLSVGIFVMATLWYYSQVTPDGMPKDFITGAAIAYTAGAFPGTTLGMVVLLFSILRVQIKRIFKDQTDDELESILPSIRMQALIDRYYNDVRRAEKRKQTEQSVRPRKSKKQIQETEDIDDGTGTDSKDNS